MGMFNTVYVKCPACGERVGFQTKSGSCLLNNYNVENAPNMEVEGIIGDKSRCECGHLVSVEEVGEPEVKIPLIIR